MFSDLDVDGQQRIEPAAADPDRLPDRSRPLVERGHDSIGPDRLERPLPVERTDEIAGTAVLELDRGRRGRKQADEAGASLVVVDEEQLGEPFLLRRDDVVDGRRLLGLRPVVRRGSQPIVLAELLVIRLGATPHHGRQRMTGGAEVPAADSGALVELDRDDLAVVDEQRLGSAVEIEVNQQSGLDGRPGSAEGEVLGLDEPTEGRDAEIGQIDPAEQAVPVAVVGLTGVEVVAGDVAAETPWHRLDEVAHPEHLLVEVVDLAVLDLEVAPDRAAQPARLRSAGQPWPRGPHGQRQAPSSAGRAHSPISAYDPVGR